MEVPRKRNRSFFFWNSDGERRAADYESRCQEEVDNVKGYVRQPMAAKGVNVGSAAVCIKV